MSKKNLNCVLNFYTEYCRSLRFEDRPDYAYLRRLMKDLFCREQIQYDFIFDWTVLNYRAQNSVGNQAAEGAEKKDP